MKKYFYRFILTLASAAVLSGAVSCVSEPESAVPAEAYNLTVQTRASAESVMNNMLFHTFYNNNSGSNDKTYKRQLITSYENGKLRSTIEAGYWHLAMVSPPAGTSLIPATAGTQMSAMTMYEYSPTIDASGRSSNAPELYTSFVELPEVIPDGTVTLDDVVVTRNVAMVQVVIKKATPSFKKPGTDHFVRLSGVPAKISYTGTLLPSASAPSVTSVQSKVTFADSADDAGFYTSNVVEFIIPAHKGSDFLADNPTDVVGVKMDITVDLERTGGSRFTDTKTIPVVALCNRILRVEITVNDGMEFTTEILPWKEVELSETVGEQYNKWLYVKKDGTGSGQSWKDAMGSLSGAIGKATALRSEGFEVNGILVAGGASNALTATENIAIPAGTRVFGGWSGASGTELTPADLNGPYTTAARNLDGGKTTVSLSDKNITVANGAVLDGFIISGVTSHTDPVVTVSSGGTANAIEIEGMTVARTGLAVSGTASNILYAGNAGGLTVSAGGKLISATVAENTGTSTVSNAMVLNTIFWRSAIGLSGTNDIKYCAFVGEKDDIPSGTGNVHINNTNDAWFSQTVTAPGPHFKLTGAEKYKAAGRRAAMLGRGDDILFDANTIFPTNYSRDINGNPRYYVDATNTSDNLMDIGCYQEQSDGIEGFRLRWLSDKMYISSKGGYVNNLPLMIPNNEDADVAVAVSWTATQRSGTGAAWSTYNGATTTATPTGVVVGNLKFTNPGQTPNNDYTENVERSWGYIDITTDLGGYMPDAEIEILQVPGASRNWEDGYVGSFHRNNEVGARYISGPNTGDWEIRVLSGLDWIKIDGNPKNYGKNITDEDEGRTPSGSYYKEVEEVWGGVIRGSGTIRFRVGMKSKNPNPEQPRYGLIVITRTVNGVGGAAMFFVRQGEAADYLYRPDHARSGGRNNAVKFSPYNIMAPGANANNGVNVGSGQSSKAVPVTHPTKVGDYFQWNQSVAYRRGVQTSNLPTHNPSTAAMTVDPCPPGYRHGKLEEWSESLYQDVAWDYNRAVDPLGADAQRNFTYGRLADGHYDQLAPDPLTSGINLVGNTSANNYNNQAIMGMLMINHFNYATIFFPCAEVMYRGRPAWTTGNQTDSALGYALYNCSTKGTNTSSSSGTHRRWHNAHWRTGHVGMNCSVPAGNSAPTSSNSIALTGHNSGGSLSNPSTSAYIHAVPVRCVVDE